MTNPLNSGLIIGDRYRLLQELGVGHYGRTYLGEDLRNPTQKYILKEFIPRIQGEYAIGKAKELFTQEAVVISRLEHPLIASWRELLTVQHQGKGCLFLVRNYVEGQSYGNLLRSRQSQGKNCTETDVILFLRKILPVLQYLHSLGLVHQDLSPENVILGYDSLPVIVDLGIVKEIGLKIESQLFRPANGTNSSIIHVGKPGYAPIEQLQRGVVAANSDLYALAVISLVLLTGKKPEQLIDYQNFSWHWQQIAPISPKFEQILAKMLAWQPFERPTSATEVLQALHQATTNVKVPKFAVLNPISSANQPIPAAIMPGNITTNSPDDTGNITPENEIESELESSEIITESDINPSLFTKIGGCLTQIAVLVAVLLISGTLGWFAGKIWLKHIVQKSPQETANPTVIEPNITELPLDGDSPFGVAETARKAKLKIRRQELGIKYQFYVDLVTQLFETKYPDQAGRSLTTGAEDDQWRERWDAIAATTLENLSFLSRQALQGMGNYEQQQRDLWKQEVNQLRLSSRALYDLADAEFFLRFPEQEGKGFMNQPIGQVWNAIVYDKLQALRSQAKDVYEAIELTPEISIKQISGNLQPGGGKAMTVNLEAAKNVEIKLVTDKPALLSLYSPTGRNNLLEDSATHTWSGVLPETGIYEITIVSQAQEPLEYQLFISK